MPKVKNCTKTGISLCAFAQKGDKKAPRAIERIDLAPGVVEDVPKRFLDSDGAKALIESGAIVTGAKATATESEEEEQAESTEESGSEEGGESTEGQGSE